MEFKKGLPKMMPMSFLTISAASSKTDLHFIGRITFVWEDDIWLGYYKVFI